MIAARTEQRSHRSIGTRCADIGYGRQLQGGEGSVVKCGTHLKISAESVGGLGGGLWRAGSRTKEQVSASTSAYEEHMPPTPGHHRLSLSRGSAIASWLRYGFRG